MLISCWQVSGTFLAGVLSAWALVQLGLCVFFVLAFFLGRRELEYLLFGLLCCSLGVMSAGIALDYFGGRNADHVLPLRLAMTGVILAPAFNVHFAACFARLKTHLRLALPLYVLALLAVGCDWSGVFWIRGSQRLLVTPLFGGHVEHWLGKPSTIGQMAFVAGSLEAVGALALLMYAYRSGRREALASLVGSAFTMPALANDVALALGWTNSVSLLPHGFLAFAFGVAGSLLLSYRRARGELEQTAQSLQQRTAELRSSHAELAVVQGELITKKQLAAVGELAAAIAHEVRNPLAVIVNAVAGLRRASGREEDRSILLGIVDEEAARLNRLVTDLLRFARPVTVVRSPVSLLELAKGSRGQAMDGHQVVVQIADDPELQTVWVDPSLFRLVFDNLVSNACQAMRDGGRVDVVVGRGTLGSNPAVEIQIRDHGHGMEASVRERALDPFFTTRPSGTGLGLPIVHRIIEAHGGEVAIDSEEGVGTTVTILLPLGDPMQAEAPASERVA
ncbi:MAG TPA: ATP-binding protein [Polyangiaceae bacterium]